MQAVTAGSGVQISPTGVLSINAADATFNGFVKTNNATAYNGYVWPNGPLPARGQLQTDASGNLTWSDTDGIQWTALGQLIVGTGINTDTILNAGINTSILTVDLTTTAGLRWSDTDTSAVLLPRGSTAQRIATGAALQGQIRYNNTLNEFEGFLGPIASMPGGPRWTPLSVQPTGPDDANRIFYHNTTQLTVNYTLPTGINAMSAGPITTTPGILVTVPTGTTWSIV